MDLTLWDHSLIDLFRKGGPVMWPLLGCSVLGLAVILDRTAALLRVHLNFAALVARLGPLLRDGKVREARQMLPRLRSPVARVILTYLDYLDQPPPLREKVVAREASVQIAHLERRMNWLAIIASVATLLGLLGTVTGLVSAFHQIELKQGQAQPGDLAAGIWGALITTVFGLVIAIPSLAIYHLLDTRVGAIGLQMQWIGDYLDDWLHQPSVNSVRHEMPGTAALPTAVKPLE